MRAVPVWEERDVVSEINDNTLYDMKKPVIEALQNAFAEEIAEFQTRVLEYASLSTIDGSEGASLDVISESYGVFRNEGESDQELRLRLKSGFILRSISVSRSDIEGVIKTLLGDEDIVIINRTGGNVWLLIPPVCFTNPENLRQIAEAFPVNHNLKISLYQRSFLRGRDLPLSRPMGSFWIDDDVTNSGSSTSLVYNKETELYGN